MVSSAGRCDAGACRSDCVPVSIQSERKRVKKKEKHTSIRLRDGLVGGAGAILGLVKSPTTCPPAGPSASLLVSLLISLLAITPAPGVVGCDDAADGGAGSAGG